MTGRGISPSLRLAIAERAAGRCVYCQTLEVVAGVGFTIDHIVPEALGGTMAQENLCLCCWDCNMAKHARVAAVDPVSGDPVRLYHPNRDLWTEHFEWTQGGLRLEGNTAIGRATVLALRLNRPLLVRARQRWIEVGWHPPSA